MEISKPLSEMSVEECEAAIAFIRSKREALKSDYAVEYKAKRIENGTSSSEKPTTKIKRLPKPIDNFTADILNILQGHEQ